MGSLWLNLSGCQQHGSPYVLDARDRQRAYPQLKELIQSIRELGIVWLPVPMLARTHGQPASPRGLVRNFGVCRTISKTDCNVGANYRSPGNLGASNGYFNAHHVAFPRFDWIDFGNRFTQR